MASLVKKTIKGIDYYYWVKSFRQGKKQGGNGKVKTIWYFLGDESMLYLPYYFWIKEVNFDEFLSKYFAFFSITTEKKYLTTKFTILNNLISSEIRQLNDNRKEYNDCLSQAIECDKKAKEDIFGDYDYLDLAKSSYELSEKWKARYDAKLTNLLSHIPQKEREKFLQKLTQNTNNMV